MRAHPKGVFIVRVAGHLFTVKDGVVYNNKNERRRVTCYFRVTPCL